MKILKTCQKYVPYTLTSIRCNAKQSYAHEMPGKPWQMVGAVIFTLNNSHFLCILDYH